MSLRNPLLSALLLGLAAAACSGNDATGAGTPNGSPPDSADSGSSSSADGKSPGQPGTPAPARCTAASGDYAGIDTSKVTTGTAPAGCLAFDVATGTLALALDGARGALLLSAENGQIHANGVACKAASGAPATTANTTITVTGSTGDDTLVLDLGAGALGALHVDMGGGTDAVFIKGSAKSDAIVAGSDHEKVMLDLSGDSVAETDIANGENFLVSLGPGDDSFRATGGKDVGGTATAAFTVYGGAGNDTLGGGRMSDALCGEAGNDTFVATSSADGADQYEGGDGIDRADYSARTGAIAVHLDDVANDGEDKEGDDVRSTVEDIIGGAGADVLTGTSGGNATILGGAGDDMLDGGPGDDTFDEDSAANGADVVNGGPGVDTVLYEHRAVALTVTLCRALSVDTGCALPACSCAADDGEAGERDNLVNVESLEGGSGNDTLSGDETDNTISGHAGNDILRGNGGDDYLYGDDGADDLAGGEGDDFLDGAKMLDIFNGGAGDGDICVIEAGEGHAACELY